MGRSGLDSAILNKEGIDEGTVTGAANRSSVGMSVNGHRFEPLLYEILTPTPFNIGHALGRSMTSLIAMIRDDKLLPVKAFIGLYVSAIGSLILASILSWSSRPKPMSEPMPVRRGLQRSTTLPAVPF